MKPEREKAPPGSEPGKGQIKAKSSTRYTIPDEPKEGIRIEEIDFEGRIIEAREEWVQKTYFDYRIPESFRRVGQYIANRINSKAGNAFPGYDTIAEAVNLSRSTVYRAVETYRRRCWLSVTKRKGKSSIYRLTFAPVILAGCQSIRNLRREERKAKRRTRVSPDTTTRVSPDTRIGKVNREAEQGFRGQASGGESPRTETPTSRDPEPELAFDPPPGTMTEWLHFLLGAGCELGRAA
jgi:hypothetical protein